jgi:prepilin-type processing-associated H-X9-DG protein
MGFSLTELFLVMAVLTLLAGLVLGGLRHGHSMVRRAGCLANLRQWGLATLLFSADHEDYLPKDGSPNGTSRHEGWYIDLPQALGLAPYSELPWRTNASLNPGRSLWICPANDRRSNGHNLFHYCLNQCVNGTGGQNQQVKWSSIQEPAVQVWLFDNGKLAAVARENNVHTNLHGAGAQFLFLDGHAARFGNQDYWDFARARGRADHPALRWWP